MNIKKYVLFNFREKKRFIKILRTRIINNFIILLKKIKNFNS